MAIDLAQLVVSMEANTAKFQKDMERVNGRLDQFSRRARSSVDAAQKAFAALGFTVAQHSKAIEMHDKELRRARNRIHRIDGALGQAVLLLHLIRRGVEVPTEVIDKIARDANSSGEPVEEE